MRDIRPGGRPGPGRGRWLRNRPIRTKLAMILLLPVLAIVGLTGLTVASAANRMADASKARELVALGAVASKLTAALQLERAAAALVFIEKNSAAVIEFRDVGSRTDGLVEDFLARLQAAQLPEELTAVGGRLAQGLESLLPLREQVASSSEAALSATTFQYRAMIADLVDFRHALGQAGVSALMATRLRSAAAFTQAIESLGRQQLITLRLMNGPLSPAGQREIVAADAEMNGAMQTFATMGDEAWVALYHRRIGADEKVLATERLQASVAATEPGTVLASIVRVKPRGWAAVTAERMEAMHSIEYEVDNDLLAAVTAEVDRQRSTITTTLSVVTGLMLLMLLVGLAVARSLTGSLTRLQAAAIEVATVRLPEMVRGLEVEHADAELARQLMAQAARPIPAGGNDEVGRVAAAFNDVTAAAVRIAGEQATLRSAVGAILVSLSRRLQVRTDAMMVSLDALEQNEACPERLEKLFRLDHIAVLIRRLIFNLQVLAGGRGTGRPRRQPVPLLDVLRAGAQEIDSYERVDIAAVDGSVGILGDAVEPLVHLLGELLDNAARFSPPDSRVTIEAGRVGDQVHIQIRDRGAGMTAADLESAREQLAHPRRLDHRATQHMGLPVVATLAEYIGARVDFRSMPGQGTWVDVTVPPGLVDRSYSTMRGPTAELAPCGQRGNHQTGAMVPAGSAAPASGSAEWRLPASPPAALAAPVIFEEMQREPAQSWFRSTPELGRPAPIPAGWAAAAQAVEGAGTAPATGLTQTGLPVRDPGQLVVPEMGPPGPPGGVFQREPERIRRQMSAFQYGLSLAGRRQAHHG